jgi:hypothetical protein
MRLRRLREIGYDPEADRIAKEAELTAYSSGNPDFPLLPSSLSTLTEEEEFIEYDESGIPPRLQDMIQEPPGSLVRLACIGVSLVSYSDKSVTKTIASLRKYLRQCISRQYVPESAFLDQIIRTVTCDRAEGRRPDMESKADQARRLLSDANAKLDAKGFHWHLKNVQLNTEEEIALHNLELQWEEARTSLNDEWNSDKMRSKFNKPSPVLLSLRNDAKLLLNAHRFSEAELVAAQITHVEQQEVIAAGERMSKAYSVALARLDARWTQDREVLKASFLKRRNRLTKTKNVSLLPLLRQVDKCQQKTAAVLETQKQTPVIAPRIVAPVKIRRVEVKKPFPNKLRRSGSAAVSG